MAKHITSEDVEEIVEKINAWQGKITWKDVEDLCVEVTGHTKTSVALRAHDDILTAYEENKETDHKARSKHKGTRPKSQALLAAEARIAKLQKNNAFLKRLNAQLNEKFLIWAANASKKHLTEADLEGYGHLPFIDRGATEED